MKIIVCISCVPDTTTKPTFKENDTKLNEAGVTFIINPYDEYSIAKAVALRDAHPGSTLTVISVAEAAMEPVIRKALAAGADDAIRINALPQNAQYVARQLAAVIKELNPDIIFTGKESIDYNGGITGGLLAEELGLPSVQSVVAMEINDTEVRAEREIEGGREVVNSSLPLVIGSQKGLGEPIIPNMRGIAASRTKPLAVREAIVADVPTKMLHHQLPAAKTGGKILNGVESVQELINLLSKEAKTI